MTFRQLLAPVLLASLLGGSGVFTSLSVGAVSEEASTPAAIHEQLRPLANLLARGEGNYNSVNRGWAGDTPQGIKGLTGSSFAGFSVNRVLEMQSGWLYAVGRYQFIPSTLRFAVNSSSVTWSDNFTPEVQDRLMAALILYKRPIVISYLQGNHDNVGAAVDALAREWACVEYRSGRGYYDGYGGNRASISRHEVVRMLQNIKDSWQPGGELP